MKPISPTRRASPLARAGFYRHFTWRASSGKRTRHLDVSHKFLLFWIKIIHEQCIGAKMSGPLARAGPLCCVYMEDFQPSQARSRVVNGEISPKRASPLSI